MENSSKYASAPRAIILTAIPVEYEAVRAHLADLHQEQHQRGTIYEQGSFSTHDCSWEVRLVEIGGGHTRTAIAIEQAIHDFEPTVILFVGVAGGLRDVSLGDVIVASKVYSYEADQENATVESRPIVWNSTYRMEQLAYTIARQKQWLRRLKGGVPQQVPHVFVGPIAAGEKLTTSTQLETLRRLKANYRDTIAVEMEGYGFLQAAYAHQQVESLIVRGISDLIEGGRRANVVNAQHYAAHCASAFAFEILANIMTETDQQPLAAISPRPRESRLPQIMRTEKPSGNDREAAMHLDDPPSAGHDFSSLWPAEIIDDQSMDILLRNVLFPEGPLPSWEDLIRKKSSAAATPFSLRGTRAFQADLAMEALYRDQTVNKSTFATYVNSVAWSPDGHYLACATGDEAVHVLEPATQKEVFVYHGHHSYVSDVAWFPSGEWIASASADRTVQIWDATTGDNVSTFTSSSPVPVVTISPDGDFIAWPGNDATVQVWQVSPRRKIFEYTQQAFAGDIRGLAFSPDGTRIASGDSTGAIQVWDVTNGGHVVTYSGHIARIYDLKWSLDGRYIASASEDGTVRVWKTSIGSTVYIHRFPSELVQAVSWSPDGTRIASASTNGTVQVWDALNGGHLFVYPHHSGAVYTVAWSPDGSMIASGDKSGAVEVWQAR